MSQGNDLGEENDQRDPLSEDFEFYFPFAKTLALDLPTPEDTSIAAAWVQKLEADPESEEEKRTRLNYLKLLLFVLQRGRLIGMFRKQPPSGALQPFPPGLSILDMGNLMLEQDDSPAYGEGDARRLPYNIEISNDLREFVASQEIPNFGVQMYYAWSSDEPVHKWLSFDEENFPQYVLDKIKQLKEVSSDEKSTVLKNGCIGPKTGCDLPLIDKCGKKKVKSPQEIEKSQGRSFHTYMGLVGRMGNFSDRCGDDPDKCQRQDPRKGKCPRKNLQKRYPGSGGEAEEIPLEDELVNFVSGLGVLNSLNRPCLCPTPGNQPQYPEQFPKGGPQHGQDQQTPRLNYTYSIVGRKPESSPWNASEYRTPSPVRYNEEQCIEGVSPQPIQSQRRSPSPRPKSISSNPPNFDCPPQDDGGFYKTEAVCCCTSPPCNCPCPRSVPQMPMRQPPSTPSAPGGGRGNVDQSPKRGAGGYPCPQGPEPGPSGAGRPAVCPGQSTRKKSPEIIHCYDSQNPDPCLTQTISRLESLSWPEDADISPFSDDAMNACFENDDADQPVFQRSPPQIQIIDASQDQEMVQGSPCPAMPGMKQKSDRYSPTSGQRLRVPTGKRSPRSLSPQGAPQPVCQVPQEHSQQYGIGSQQYAQNYQESARPGQMRPPADPCAAPNQQGNQFEDLCAFLNQSPPKAYESSGFTARPQARPGLYDPCGRPAADPCAAPPQQGNQIEDLCAFLNQSPPKPSGMPGKAAQARPGSRGTCARPGGEQRKPMGQRENAPVAYENAFGRPAAGTCQPQPSHWSAAPNLSEFVDRLLPRTGGYAQGGYEDECGPQTQQGNQFDDICSFLSQSPKPSRPPAGIPCKPPGPPSQPVKKAEDPCGFQSKPKSVSPSGLTGRPQGHPGPYDPCGPPTQQGNQIEDLCAFLNKSPPKAVRPSPGGPAGKSAQGRPGSRDACSRPATEPCKRTPPPASQQENIYAFLDKYPPDVAGLTPPPYENVFGRPAVDVSQPSSPHWNSPRVLCDFSDNPPPSAYGYATSIGQPSENPAVSALMQGINQKNDAHRVKCDQSGARKPQNDGGFCQPPAQPPANVCVEQAPCGGVMASNYGVESRPPRSPVGADTGACKRQPASNLKAPNRGKTVTSTTRQPLPTCQQMHPICPQAYGNTGQESCEADEEEEDECDSEESAGDVCPKESEATYLKPNASQRIPGRPQQAAPSAQIYGSQMVMPGKAPVKQDPSCYAVGEGQGKAPQWAPPSKTYAQEGNFYREPSMETSSHWKTLTGQTVEETYDEDWDDMPSSASQMAKYGYGIESEKQECPPGKTSPGKTSKQESNAITIQGNVAHMPMTGPSYAKESRKSREPDVQSCLPQQPSQGNAGQQDQTQEEWAELESGFSDKTLSGCAPTDNATPTWFPLIWGKEAVAEAVAAEEQKAQRKTPGKVFSQEPVQSCAQPGTSSQGTGPRKRPNLVLPGSCPPGQDNAGYGVPSYRENAYLESSLMNKGRPCKAPTPMCSTPKEWSRPITQDAMPSYSTINQFDSTCQSNDASDQIQINFYDDEDDKADYMPLYSLNADLTAGKFFNFPEVAPQNEQCPQDRTYQRRPRSAAPAVSFQTCEDEDTFDYCDNSDSYY